MRATNSDKHEEWILPLATGAVAALAWLLWATIGPVIALGFTMFAWFAAFVRPTAARTAVALGCTGALGFLMLKGGWDHNHDLRALLIILAIIASFLGIALMGIWERSRNATHVANVGDAARSEAQRTTLEYTDAMRELSGKCLVFAVGQWSFAAFILLAFRVEFRWIGLFLSVSGALSVFLAVLAYRLVAWVNHVVIAQCVVLVATGIMFKVLFLGPLAIAFLMPVFAIAYRNQIWLQTHR